MTQPSSPDQNLSEQHQEPSRRVAEIENQIAQCRNRIQQHVEREEYIKADAAYKELSRLQKQKQECEYEDKIDQEKEKLKKVHEDQRQRREEFNAHWKEEEAAFEQRSQQELASFIVCQLTVLIITSCTISKGTTKKRFQRS